ncbi:TLR adapter interacting with SLC15A4 on the lysosome [Brachyhypopomus gauderio]|uniref:TLR adapter interacting with SLC15A4 on the lysosome n=1 Tax=Brachyhypopomus gauderio TaxID=698409 RepID=UPI004042AF18
MLCESSLWCVAFSSRCDSVDPPTCFSVIEPKSSLVASTLSGQTPLTISSSPEEHSISSRGHRFLHRGSPSPSAGTLDCRLLSPGVGIPGRAGSPGPEAFLVPSSCHSICQHYSDLHIAGGQVLPLSPSAEDPQSNHLKEAHAGPFLVSGDVPPPSLPPPSLPETRSSRHWREGSGRERASLLQAAQPLSNSQLNVYLEQKLLELYREYLSEGPAGPRPVMASELLQSSLEQMTLQLSREHRLETTRAKDMLLSCLLRATSSQQSSEISTPVLQISTQTK